MSKENRSLKARESLGITYPLRASNFQNLPCSGSKCSLSTDHVSAVTEHQNANKWVAVKVPANNRLFIQSFVVRFQLPIFLFFGLDTEVYMADFKVHLDVKIHTSDGGNDFQCLWILPCVVYEWGISEKKQLEYHHSYVLVIQTYLSA